MAKNSKSVYKDHNHHHHHHQHQHHHHYQHSITTPPAPKSAVRFLLLLALFAHHAVALYAVTEASRTPVSGALRRRLTVHADFGLRFLTIWNFIGQLVYIGTELAFYLLPPFLMNHKQCQRLYKFANHASWLHYLGVVAPTSLFVPALFWSIYAYDRELILPRIAEVFMPQHLNHCVHTLILLLVAVEWCASMRDTMPPKRVLAWTNFWYMFGYAFTLLFTFFWDDHWMYPFLDELSWGPRIVFFVACFGATQITMRLALALQQWRCSKVGAKRHKKS